MLKTAYIEYQDGDVVLEGYLAYDEDATEPRPAVLVAHDWTGRRDYACAGAERIVELGYIGFAVDIYGKGVFGKEGDTQGNSALMTPFVNDREALRRRMLAGLAALRTQPAVDADNIAVMGYCFGGMAALELARAGADVKGAVSVHGLLGQGDLANKKIHARVLCLHGHDDPRVSPDHVLAFETEMSKAKVDRQVHIYGGTREPLNNSMVTLRVTAPAAARRRAPTMAVALGKHDNAAEAAQTPARRGLQPIPLAALPLLDRRTHAGASSPCQRNRLKARVTIELFRGSLNTRLLIWLPIILILAPSSVNRLTAAQNRL